MSVPETPVDIVAERIAVRYRNPSRKAYLYLFRLAPSASLDALVPPADHVVQAWIDNGNGLVESAIEGVVAACADASQVKPHTQSPTRLSPHERKQMMARSILFTAHQPDQDTVEVNLASRALGFSPKGDRVALEVWKRTVDGTWYSTRRERDEAEDAE